MGIKQMFALGGQKVHPVTITVDEEAQVVYVGKLSVAQMDRLMKYMEDKDVAGMNTYLVQVGSYDDAEGHRAFSDSQEDTKYIKSCPVQFVKALADEVLKFNTMATVEDATKN